MSEIVSKTILQIKEGLKKRELLIKNLLKAKIQLGIHYLPGYKLQFFRKNKSL